MPRILIAEDDKTMQEFYREALGDRFDLVIVEDSNLALEKLGGRDYCLLITDLNMPGWDGNTAVSGAMALDNRLPIIVASGYVGEPDIDSVTDIFPNISGILRKPFTIDELLAQVEKAIKAA